MPPSSLTSQLPVAWPVLDVVVVDGDVWLADACGSTAKAGWQFWFASSSWLAFSATRSKYRPMHSAVLGSFAIDPCLLCDFDYVQCSLWPAKIHKIRSSLTMNLSILGTGQHIMPTFESIPNPSRVLVMPSNWIQLVFAARSSFEMVTAQAFLNYFMQDTGDLSSRRCSLRGALRRLHCEAAEYFIAVSWWHRHKAEDDIICLAVSFMKLGWTMLKCPTPAVLQKCFVNLYDMCDLFWLFFGIMRNMRKCDWMTNWCGGKGEA